MSLHRRGPNLSSRAGRVIAAVALFGYLAGSIGFPMPVLSGSIAQGVPAGCRAGGCGCAESDQAQSMCCCCQGGRNAAQPACPRCAAKAGGGTAVAWVAGISARKCRGLETEWFFVQGGTPPPSPLTWSHEDAPAGRTLPICDVPSCVTFSPPVPPPRG